MKLTIHFDGGSRGNPGPASAGIVIHDAATHQPIYEAGHYLGRCTNNVAEYQAFIRSLKQAQAMGGEQLDIRSDSELLVRQITGQYRVKSADLKPLYEQAKKLLEGFDDWKIQHVYREKNQRADELANLAIDHKADVTGDTPLAPGPVMSAGPVGRDHATPTTVCWTAKLTGRNGKCLAGCSTNNEYTFGPTTPEGFCVHAASAMLHDGPLNWPDKKITDKTRCPACGLTIQMHILHRDH